MNHQPNSETSARLAAVSVHRSTRRLILWDIDHTLIETRGLGGELYANAFEIATGTRMVHKADVTGQTEPSILIATLRLHGITEDEPHLSRYEAALPAAYDRHRDLLARRGRILPGARQTLAALASRPQLMQSVLTGNLREVARIKLEVFGLDRYLDLDVGAYGGDDTDGFGDLRDPLLLVDLDDTDGSRRRVQEIPQGPQALAPVLIYLVLVFAEARVLDREPRQLLGVLSLDDGPGHRLNHLVYLLLVVVLEDAHSRPGPGDQFGDGTVGVGLCRVRGFYLVASGVGALHRDLPGTFHSHERTLLRFSKNPLAYRPAGPPHPCRVSAAKQC